MVALPFAGVAPGAAAPDDAAGKSIEEIQRSIDRNGYHWTAGQTSVSDIPWEEFKQRLGYRRPAGSDSRPRVDLSPGSVDSPVRKGELPPRWDWREHEGVTPVKDQGNCGSCWAFCSTAALEACARINDHEIYDLSEQQMLDCNANGYGCGGGWMESCYEVYQSYGAVAEEAIPYRASDGVVCNQAQYEPLARISSYFPIDESVESIKAAVYAYGPVAVAMTVFSDFQAYSGDCYEHRGNGDLNHGILILGWDDTRCGGVWICKNSWGTGWGDQGFFYIRYGSSDVGTDPVAIVHVPRVILTIGHTPPATTTRGGDPFAIEAMINSNRAEIDPDSVSLHFAVDGGDFVSVAMTPGAPPDTWNAEIPAQRRPSEVRYFIRAVDREGHEACRPIEAPEASYSFDIASAFDPFEADSTGWTVGAPDDGATAGIWTRVDPLGTAAQPDSDCTAQGSACWVTGQQVEGDGAGANDVDGGKTTLTSPRFDLYDATTARIKYARWFSNDRGAAPGEDLWLVQARNNFGEWVEIERTTESSNAWVTVRADLMSLLGADLGSVQFRFVAADDGRPSNVEAAIDDFTLLADPDTTVVPWKSNGPGILVSNAWPNPLRNESKIRLQVEAETSADAKIYGPDGRFVTQIYRGDLDRKRHELVWNGRDAAGRPVPSGVYYLLLHIGDETIRSPLVVVR